MCTKVNHPNILPGYGCCKCNTYNGNQRESCKTCNHPRCDKSTSDKIVSTIDVNKNQKLN
jgi:hypothetical protein